MMLIVRNLDQIMDQDMKRMLKIKRIKKPVEMKRLHNDYW